MQEGADVEAKDVTLEAPLAAKVSAKWVLQFKGEAFEATRRAEHFVEQPHGTGCWLDVAAHLPSGGTERIFISPDANLNTARTEMHTKKRRTSWPGCTRSTPSTRNVGTELSRRATSRSSTWTCAQTAPRR